MDLWEILKVSKGLPPSDLETLLLARKIRKNITEITTADDYPCILEKSVGKPVINYRIYGNSVQNGTPSPDNPVEIQSVGNPVYAELFDSEGLRLTDSEGYELHSNDVSGYKIPVVTSGKNLFDFNNTDFTKGGYLDVSGNFISQNSWIITDYISVRGNSFTVNNQTGRLPAICLYDKNKNFIAGKAYNNNEVTTVTCEKQAYYCRFSIHNSVNINAVQLEIGSTVTEYEPYHEPITTTIYLDEPLRKIGDYADMIDFSGGAVERNIEKIHLTSNLNWTLQSINIYGIANFYVQTNALVNLPSVINRFSIQETGITSTTNEGYRIAGENMLHIRILQSRASSVAEFKKWLDENPTYIEYVLDESQTTKITLSQLQTLNGTTIITTDTAVQPSNIEITYKSRGENNGK